MLIRKGRPIPVIFLLNGMRVEGIMIDILHTVDLGVTAHVLGNIFVEVMASGVWGTNQATSAAGLHEAVRDWEKIGHGLENLVCKVRSRTRGSRLAMIGQKSKQKERACDRFLGSGWS